MSVAVVLCLFGIAMTVAAHNGSKTAERRARERYRELVGEAPDVPENGWQEIRPLAARWGCLFVALEFVRGVGVVVTLGTGIYLIAG